MAQDIEHEKTAHGERAPACTVVIFGAGGDLTKRLLMPALYNLARTNLLPTNFALIGVDRLEMSDEAFRSHVEESVRAFAADKHYAQTLDEANLKRRRRMSKEQTERAAKRKAADQDTQSNTARAVVDPAGPAELR